MKYIVRSNEEVSMYVKLIGKDVSKMILTNNLFAAHVFSNKLDANIVAEMLSGNQSGIVFSKIELLHRKLGSSIMDGRVAVMSMMINDKQSLSRKRYSKCNELFAALGLAKIIDKNDGSGSIAMKEYSEKKMETHQLKELIQDLMDKYKTYSFKNKNISSSSKEITIAQALEVLKNSINPKYSVIELKETKVVTRTPLF